MNNRLRISILVLLVVFAVGCERKTKNYANVQGPTKNVYTVGVDPQRVPTK